ncbi:hypothetical protein [Brevundimonas sp.]|uniref:hypothetical protein n=1 Tax=Brevundimonas sp. TaxID=1871086 RepID=UPI003567E1E8
MKRLAIALFVAAALTSVAACGTTRSEKAATGAVAGAVVAGPVGAVVGGVAGAALAKPK